MAKKRTAYICQRFIPDLATPHIFFYLIYPRSSQLSGDPGCPIPRPLVPQQEIEDEERLETLLHFIGNKKTKHQKMTETYTNQL